MQFSAGGKRNSRIWQVACLLLLVLSVAVWATARQSDVVAYGRVFSEPFRSSSSADRWLVSTNWRTRGMRLVSHPRSGGLHFEAGTMGRWQATDDFAVAEWPIGRDEFRLRFAVELMEGRLQKYFEAGVSVVLCPLPPDQMGRDDICVVIQISYAGIGMAVWQGWFLDPDARQISQTTHDVNGLESVPWHMQYFQDVRLQFQLERSASELFMSVSSSELPELAVWHCEQCDLASLPVSLEVNHIVVQRVPVRPEHLGYPDFQLRGRVYDFCGSILHDTAPEFSRDRVADVIDFSPHEVLGEGDVITLTGIPADAVDEVIIGGQTCERLSINGNAELQVRVPVLPVGRHKVEVRINEAQFSGKRINRAVKLLDRVLCVGQHPVLLWDSAYREELMQRFQDPRYASCENGIRSSAAGGNWLSLLLLAELAGEETAVDELLPLVRQVCRERRAVRFDAVKWGEVALVYDTLFARLQASDRDLIRGYLEFVLKSYALTREDWFFEAKHNPSNTVAVSNAGGGLAALALLGTDVRARSLATMARKRLSQFAAVTIRSDGGYIEGTLYWDYAMTSYLRFLTAWRHSGLATAADRIDPHLDRMPAYVEAVLVGGAGMATFNDTQPWLTGLPTISFLANEFDVPWLDALGDQMTRRNCNGISDAFVFRSARDIQVEMPQLPPGSVLPVSQLVTFRSSPVWNRGATVSIAGTQARLSHHAQQDQGGLIYSSEGQPLIIDPGYYQPDATAHSVPLIGDVGPAAGVSSRLLAAESVGQTYLATFDLTMPYVERLPDFSLISLRRTVVFHRDDLVVIDQLDVGEDQDSFSFEQQIQLAVQPHPLVDDTSSVRFRLNSGDGHGKELRVIGDGWKSQVEGPRDFGRSWIFRRQAEQGELTWYSVRMKRLQASDVESVWCVTSPDSDLLIDQQENSIRCRFADGQQVFLDRRPKGLKLRGAVSLLNQDHVRQLAP